ncbi:MULTISPECIES: sigma-54-dependent transcriptional regulator [Marinobacter]|jgi:two-component system, response regulator FlrC|uniref:Fis family transcriptional regulator n=2 Tax=Pseudomonadota TaxID=1224 RepID=W5YUL2_9GAMM|nr:MULTISPECIES: sigma-54 dependent transcriptional regulator [Marinobacter]AHI32755.1 Fis family transcriptional regulator [Marinobacter salarius]ARM83608.1 transcriptional regulatory protein ZraR [Marinobacter salarius]MAB51317.1 sigma-54-dependent Fis family transcriptional regulator [Marinobacter sp.]MBJ7299822.1 sigma-54-dependent Fis family transcriptional regulator [Marinobacter salarius]MCC4282736.1 sigma-54 dependent transcriptional regulator [Marinobacter salarius]|tara:strand:+ start:3370 stop:4836 length:1467 start_codon:yes stop_codon:yes gene_type:complete
MAKAQILIVEDDQDLREALVTTLELAKFRVREAANAEQALAKLAESPVDMVVSDVNMPGMSGHDLLHEIQRRYPGLPTMLITAYGQISHAVSAMQSGAIDYLVKPFEPSVLVDAVTRVVGGGRQKSVDQPVAEDPISKRMFQLAAKVAASDSTVMISGESGTGKEVLARYIHQQSPRSDQAFVAINCAAIPENMLEAILFGHEKGAFTGAVASSPGKFEQANGGTILLDEISEMDPGLQSKLLRVLQEREVERVGGRKTIALDVRVIATTNRDLSDYVRENKFREDLYYRLTVFPMHWQPLRERTLDIMPLANALLKNHCRKMKLTGVTFAPDARDALMGHQWPGNVRELDNAIQRALVLHQGNVIHAGDLCLELGITGRMESGPAGTTSPASPHPVVSESGAESPDRDAQDTYAEESLSGLGALSSTSLGDEVRQREFRIIIQTLKKERGRRNRAAEQLGISPRTLRYKLAQMRDAGIDLDAELAAA